MIKKPVCLYNGQLKELQSGDILTATSLVEVSLGSTPRRSGHFTITGSGFSSSAALWQASGPYTGKGTRADESEMDFIGVSAQVTSSATIQGYWVASGWVKGNFKFNYRSPA